MTETTYTDGSAVQENDSIRYRQAPGGLIAPSGNWTYGIAAKFPHSPEILDYLESNKDETGYLGVNPDELYLKKTLDGEDRYFHITGHIIEKVVSND